MSIIYEQVVSQTIAFQSTLSDRVVAYSANVYNGCLKDAGGTQILSATSSQRRPSLLVALYKCQPYDLHVPSMQALRIAITLSRSKVAGGIEDDRPQLFNTTTHSVFLTPAHASANWRKEDPSRHLCIYIDPEYLANDGDQSHFSLFKDTLHNVTPHGVREVAQGIESELAASDHFSIEAIDGFVQILISRLARQIGASKINKTRSFDRVGMFRLREFVAANISRRLLVSELAKEVGLAPHTFACSFREYAGMTPHQFVLDFRIRRAMELLGSTKSSVTEIALDCGFSSQQHLTHCMRHRIGITPGALRTV